jgi:phage shock protein B
MMEMFEVPLILFLTIVAPIWIIAHYVTRWRMAKTLSPQDEKQFGDLWQIAERMEERIHTIERILESETPGEDRAPPRARPGPGLGRAAEGGR